MLSKIIFFPITYLLIAVIYLYKICLSPFLGDNCRFQPSCSTYAITALKNFGLIKGVYLAVKRISRCRPNGKSGYDLVPDNIKGDIKWVI